jgi:hypothetical protein
MVADWLSVSATVTLDDVDGLPTVTSSALQVRGKVPGLDSVGFQSAIAEAAALCPVSRLLPEQKSPSRPISYELRPRLRGLTPSVREWAGLSVRRDTAG